MDALPGLATPNVSGRVFRGPRGGGGNPGDVCGGSEAIVGEETSEEYGGGGVLSAMFPRRRSSCSNKASRFEEITSEHVCLYLNCPATSVRHDE